MSERPPSIAPARPALPRDSGVGIIIRRKRGKGREVLLGKRSRRSRFLPGSWAFIGGSLEEQDEPHRPDAFARCVSREVLEETGIDVPPESWHEAGTRITPPIYSIRFDSRFFVAEVDEDVTLPSAPPRPEELEELRFFPPGLALAEWDAGEMDLPPVLPPVLRILAESRKGGPVRLAEKIKEAHDLEEKTPRIECIPGVWMLALESRTLPPATHTNAWLVGGERFVIVDPGSDDPDEQRRLFDVVERRRSAGSEPDAVVLTHHHADHTAGAVDTATRFEVPIKAHAATLERLPAGAGERVELQDGEKIDLAGESLEVLHTPGHASGHVALYMPNREAAIIGDLLSGQSTILIDPEEGDMGAYIASLRRLSELRCHALFPGHGVPLGPEAVEAAIEHRWGRESGILAALSRGPRSLDDIAREAYQDTPKIPELLAQTQTSAHLAHLERKGAVSREGDAWQLVG